MDSDAADRVKEMKQAVARRLERIRYKVLVLSGKGGVGKSTVAVNLAAALARAGSRVGVLDVDIHGPSVPRLLGLEGRHLGSADGRLTPVRVDSHLVVASVGFLLADPSSAVAWRGPRKFALIRQLIADVEWGDLDFLVIDSPPGTGDEPMAVSEFTEGPLPRPPGWRPDRSAILVTTPQLLAIDDVRRCITFCKEVCLPVFGIVENMTHFVCPHCGERTEIFRSGGGRRLAREAGVPFLGGLPLDPAILDAGERGIPVTAEAHSSATSAAESAKEVFARIARELTVKCEALSHDAEAVALGGR